MIPLKIQADRMIIRMDWDGWSFVTPWVVELGRPCPLLQHLGFFILHTHTHTHTPLAWLFLDSIDGYICPGRSVLVEIDF